ncbi:MAG TPA: HAMP domain-containing histidine kinase [Candidatus Enterenecus stercoripullorum]|nr:HAMP domain-containing histidine kinase [Candidatus Enterenecus stercoripullorum]
MNRETLAASVAGTAAQLRMQLADLTAASQMLERTADGEKACAYLAVLNQSICRMLRTVGQMELLNRLTDEDELRTFPAPTDLGPWTRELAERVRGILRGGRVSLDYQGPEILLANVDQGLVKQMLLELIAAVAQPGGEVVLTLAQREENACFTVRGVGTQIPAGELARMLDRPGGTLPKRWEVPLARQIAELHAGSLVAETAAGGRVSLVAILPLRLGMPAGHMESPALPYDAGGFRDELVAFSDILPAQVFSPEALG